MYHDYIEFERFPAAIHTLIPALLTPLRAWDFAAAQRVDYFVAGSFNASRRIAKYYRRESEVLQPPIVTSDFRICGEIGDYFLVVSRLQPYKRIDLAIEACSRLELPLHVIGDGPDRSRLQSLAGASVQFFGRLADADVRTQLSQCRAFLLPGEEDFGLTPLEAQASGRPVIAYRAGGALETVKEGITGYFFPRQTVEALMEALRHFRDDFEPETLRRHAMQFDKAVFKQRLYNLLEARFTEHRRKYADLVSG
jgi:glycosyltransferase involved in cell wall biosynthesis